MTQSALSSTASTPRRSARAEGGTRRSARVRPEATAFLERYDVVSVPGAPGDTVVRDLRRSR